MSTSDQYTWTATGAPNNSFNSVASSNDGTNLFSTVYLGAIYTSNNSGVVWNKALGTDGGAWNNIVCSNSGSRVVASSNGSGPTNPTIYLSSDTGNTWTPTNSPTTIYNWTSLALDASGTYLYAIASNGGGSSSTVYLSTYPFTTWTVIFTVAGFLGSIASSSNGQKLAVTYSYSYGIYGIYTGTTTNYIAWTWTLQAGASSSLRWDHIACNSSGQNLVATVDGSGIYTSNNAGVTWNGPVLGNRDLVFSSMASSSSGQYLSTTCQLVGMFTSIDYGQTFVQQIYTPGFSWLANACSGDGSKLVASYQITTYGSGGIYIGVPPLPFVPPPAPVPANTVIGGEQSLSTVNSQYATPITIAFSNYALTAYIQQLAAALSVGQPVAIQPSYIEVESALPGSVKINYKMTIPANSGVDINNLVASINTLNVNQIPAIVNSVSALWVVPKAAVTSQSQTTVVYPDPIPPIPPPTPSTEITIITAEMKFSGPGTDINTPGLSQYIYGEFIIELAAVLTIPASYITILSLLPGSIVVTYAITIPIGSTIDVDALVALINSLNQKTSSMTTIINTLASLWNILASSIIVFSHVISVIRVPNYETICFKEGTKILCYLSKGNDIYIPIEQITNTKYIKTYKHGYKKVKYVIKSTIFNSSKSSINKLYVCRKTPENGLIEDLYVTGSHALLYDKIPSEKQELMEKLIEEYDIDYPMKIDGKHKLIAYYDDHFRPYNKEGITNVYHIIIDNENDPYKNYGIYANGALAESSDEFTLARINTKTNANNIGFNTNIRVNNPNLILNTKTKKTYFEEQMELKQYQQKMFKN